MSTSITLITPPAVRSAEFIFTGPESLRARAAKTAEQTSFRSSNPTERR